MTNSKPRPTTRAGLKRVLDKLSTDKEKIEATMAFAPHITEEQINQYALITLKLEEAATRNRTKHEAWEYACQRGFYNEKEDWFETDFMIAQVAAEEGIMTLRKAIAGQSGRVGGCVKIRGPNSGYNGSRGYGAHY